MDASGDRTAINPAMPANERTGARRSMSSAGRTGVRAAAKVDQPDSELEARMARLYGVYAGQELRTSRKGKFTLGLGVSIGLVLLGVGVGGYFAYTSFKKAPTVAVSTPGVGAAAPTAKATGGASVGASGEPGPTATVAPVAAQAVDATHQWSRASAGGVSSVALLSTRVGASCENSLQEYRFRVQIRPESSRPDSRLGTQTTVVLFRGLKPDGPFTQVDRAAVGAVDVSTGQLDFSLRDGQLAGVASNAVYYRLSGVDSEGKRLFDTDAGRFFVLPAPVIEGDRVKWAAARADEAVPPVSFGIYLAAPGWEQTMVSRFAAAGAVDQELPAVRQAVPLRVVMRSEMPVAVEVSPQSAGWWQVGTLEHELAVGRPRSGTGLQGVVPVCTDGRISYQFIPNEQAFTDVRQAQVLDDQAGVPSVLTFRMLGEAKQQTLTVPARQLRGELVPTPLNGAVQLTWAAGQDAPEASAAAVVLAVDRIGPEGERQRVGSLPAKGGTIVDQAVRNGVAYQYEWAVVEGDVGIDQPTRTAEAWLAGFGRLPILLASPPSGRSAAVTPEAALSKLNVAFGPHELCYPGTGQAAFAVMRALGDALWSQANVAVVDRVGAKMLAGTSGAGALAGGAAQLRLRLVDSSLDGGELISLWATDLVTGRSVMLAEAPVAAVDAKVFVQAAMSMIEPRLPEVEEGATAAAELVRPEEIYFGALRPVEQSALCTEGEFLRSQLMSAIMAGDAQARVMKAEEYKATNSGASASGAVLITGWVWRDDSGGVGMLVYALEPATGQVVDHFVVERVEASVPGLFADWCGQIRLARASSAAAMAEAGASPLVKAETALEPVHPVWRELGRSVPARRPTVMRPVGAETVGTLADERVTVTLGLPLPAKLRAIEVPRVREQNDPLWWDRPLVASGYPLMFDEWTAAQAKYVQEDFEAFRKGADELAAAMRGGRGAAKLQLIVRGQVVSTAAATVADLTLVNTDPTALNTRDLFKLTATGRSVVNYRQELSDLFAEHPWAGYHVWKQVPAHLALPFLKGQMLGVEKENYGPITVVERPPALRQYLAAALLAELGHPLAAGYRRKALAESTHVAEVLTEKRPTSLSGQDQQDATNGLLILLVEKDEKAIELLRDATLLQQYIRVQPDQAAETLRLLLDQLGPVAWTWAGKQQRIEPTRMLWRSPEELRQSASAMPEAFLQPLELQIQAWGGLESMQEGWRMRSAEDPRAAVTQPVKRQ
jgi:hypothetical protein